VQLLIDENLSPTLARRAHEIGIPAQAVRDVGLIGQPDIYIWRYAWDHDLVVVTLNVGDFLNLAKSFEIHPGIITLREAGLDRAEQWQRLKKALDFSTNHCEGDLLNKVLEIQANEAIQLHDIPMPD